MREQHRHKVDHVSHDTPNGPHAATYIKMSMRTPSGLHVTTYIKISMRTLSGPHDEMIAR